MKDPEPAIRPDAMDGGPRKRRVVYTALMGDYESIQPQPHRVEIDADFVLFTDSATLNSPDWKVIRVRPRFSTDSVRSARYLKIAGHPFLDRYQETLWIDNRVVLKPSAIQLFDLLGDADIALGFHSFRESLQGEFEEVIASGYDDPTRVRQLHSVNCEAGTLCERPYWTGLLARRRNSAVASCMEKWFEWILFTSRRDQLSFNVSLRQVPEVHICALEIDNLSSEYHEWRAVAGIQRNVRVQLWRPARVGLSIRIFDSIRAKPLGRKFLRLLAKFGVPTPFLCGVPTGPRARDTRA